MTRRSRPRATLSMVTSSCVGPTPPEVKTKSKTRWNSATAGAMASSSSGTVTIRLTVTPRVRSSRVRKGELVSTTFPERISFPMTMMPAVRSTSPPLHRDGVLAEVAGPDPDVHDGRLAGPEGPLERGTDLLRALDPFAVAPERLDHQVVPARR